MPVTRQQVIEKAREYVGTKFADKGRRAGQGLDCVGLVLCVCHDLGLADKNGKPLTRTLYDDYSSQPAGNFVHLTCHQHLIAKGLTAMRAGDVVTMALPSAPCHVGIVGADNAGNLTLIHSYDGGARKCVEHLIDHSWRRRIVGCFQIPGVE